MSERPFLFQKRSLFKIFGAFGAENWVTYRFWSPSFRSVIPPVWSLLRIHRRWTKFLKNAKKNQNSTNFSREGGEEVLPLLGPDFWDNFRICRVYSNPRKFDRQCRNHFIWHLYKQNFKQEKNWLFTSPIFSQIKFLLFIRQKCEVSNLQRDTSLTSPWYIPVTPNLEGT